MKHAIAVSLALVLVGVLGCGQEEGPTNVVSAPEFLNSPPAESGIVTRDGLPIGGTFVDVETGLRSALGVSLQEFCTGTAVFDVVDFMSLATPVGNNVLHIMDEDVYAEVWPAGPFDCGTFVTSDPIATGTVRFVRTDNDWNLDGGRANAYGYVAQGTLYGADGTAYRFSSVLRLRWPDGAALPEVQFLKVTLTPMPS